MTDVKRGEERKRRKRRLIHPFLFSFFYFLGLPMLLVVNFLLFDLLFGLFILILMLGCVLQAITDEVLAVCSDLIAQKISGDKSL